MFKFLRSFFSVLNGPTFFEIDPKKIYSKEDLINILKTQDLSVGQGNAIVLYLLETMNKEIEELKNK